MSEAMHLLPLWVQYWMVWLVIINVLSLVFVYTHIEARWIAGVFVLVAISMELLFQQVGMVRLLGIVHVVLWTPLLIYLVRRLPDIAVKTIYGGYLRMFLLTITISLVFDYVDVVRHFMGHTY